MSEPTPELETELATHHVENATRLAILIPGYGRLAPGETAHVPASPDVLELLTAGALTEPETPTVTTPDVELDEPTAAPAPAAELEPPAIATPPAPEAAPAAAAKTRRRRATTTKER